MKLIVQIPVLNEADSIAQVIAGIPRQIPGIASVEVLIVDDGCTDDTVAVALAHGADHVVRHKSRKGLAAAYQTGIDTALRLGADIIVNTDGDNQYPGGEIPRLLEPILAGQADMVIGDRQVTNSPHFSPLKRQLQALGSGVVRWASETDVPDTVSGFRALTREYALRTFVTSEFSYTVESLIQAGKRRMTIRTVPIATNHVERASRLHRGNWNFIKRQGATIARTYAMHEPLKTFSYMALALFAFGVVALGRAAYIFIGRRLNWFPVSLSNDQALLVGAVLVVLALITFLIGLVADLIGANRRQNEEILYRVRRQEAETEEWRRQVLARMERIERSVAADAVLNQPERERGA
jgi:glycosyltransferase involved in cell wall biosynthesis